MRPHQQRVVDEKQDIDGKIERLAEFFTTDIFHDLDQAEKDRLKTQYSVMEVYSMILYQRIEAFPLD